MVQILTFEFIGDPDALGAGYFVILALRRLGKLALVSDVRSSDV